MIWPNTKQNGHCHISFIIYSFIEFVFPRLAMRDQRPSANSYVWVARARLKRGSASLSLPYRRPAGTCALGPYQRFKVGFAVGGVSTAAFGPQTVTAFAIRYERSLTTLTFTLGLSGGRRYLMQVMYFRSM